ncbi:acyl carrier protein [Streptomyces hypolithicus]
MTVRSALESAYGIALPASLTFDHPSVRRITEFLDAQLSGDAG